MVVAVKRRVHTWGGGRGERRGPKRGPCTLRKVEEEPEAPAILLCCDSIPDLVEAGQRIAGCITIVGPPSRPYRRVEFPGHFYQDWHKRDWDWGVSKPKLAGQIFGNTCAFI